MNIGGFMSLKRAIIVHGWDGYPEEGWFPWLRKELEQHQFEVTIPQMPEAEAPKIDSWVSTLAKTVEIPDAQTYLIGHSIGCQTILRYVAALPPESTVGPLILVAPFLELLTLGNDSLKSDKEEAIARPWLTTPIAYDSIRLATPKIIAIFSDNDPFVPLKNAQLFKEWLGAETVILSKMGHFSGSSGTTELPIVLENILAL
jgi:predicted alpha/beta hydrolase family esterase